jgi:hypothetical protein
MQRLNHQLITILVREEIERIVSQAARGSGFIRAGEHAYRLLKQFPNPGMTGDEVVNEIVAAAANAGIAVEISQPQPLAA